MRRQLKRLIALGLIVTMASPPAALSAPQTPKHGGTCVSGDCVNGFGTVRGTRNEYTGNWSNSWFMAGSYSVLYGAFPNQRYEVVIDAQQFPLKGTVQRGSPSDTLRNPTIYTGTFARVYHPFDKKYVPRYAHGRYSDTSDVVYDGDFDFIPARSTGVNGGYYIFQGVRIDEDADQVRPGLYISDWTTNDVPLGDYPSVLPIIFHRATADYIAKLQDDLRQDLQAVDAEESAKRSKDRESRESWNSLFTAAVGFAAVVGTMHLASRSSGAASSVSAVSDTLAGKQSSQDATTKMVADLRERAKTDPALAKRIGNSTNAELVAKMKQAGSTAPPTMTVAEYRNATGNRVSGTMTGNAGTPPSNDNALRTVAVVRAQQDMEKKHQDDAQRAKEASERAREQEEKRRRDALEKSQQEEKRKQQLVAEKAEREKKEEQEKAANRIKEGCFIPPRYPVQCVVVDKTRMNKDEFTVTYRNNCEGRVYMSFCNMHKDGSADCGADGVRQGGKTSWQTYNATGAYAYKYTGSRKAEYDWVCGDENHDPEYKRQDLKHELGAK